MSSKVQIYPTSEHFLGHAIAVFGRGIEVVPRDVMVFQGMFLEEMDEKDKDWRRRRW